MLTASTPDQALAICVAQLVDAAIVDGKALRGHDWSVVKSLKMVKRNLPVILVEERKPGRATIPKEVDAIVEAGAADELITKLKTLLKL